MSKWEVKEIKQFGRVVTGKTPPKDEKKYFDGEYLFVSPKDLELDKLYVFETETRITKEALDKFKNQVIPKNAVMYTSLSFSFGKIGISSEAVLTNQQISSVIVNSNHDFRFVYYLLRANRPLIFSYNSGIDTPIVPKSVFEKIEFRCPPLPIQKKIAAVLSAYDDLIENNDRRITLLEKMAEEIYREWFVRLRFPGHGQTTFHKGIPKGWEVKCVKELVDRKKFGRIYRENELHTEGQIIVIDQSRNDCLGFYNGKPEHIASKDDPFILFGDHTCKLLLINSGFSLAENVIPFKPKGNTPARYLFHLIQGLIETTEYKRHWTELCNKQVFVAPTNIQLKFNELVENNYNSIDAIICINKVLRKTRDRLLTRLISGKLSVEDLDIQFPPSMTTDP